jgi:hypothetical protein
MLSLSAAPQYSRVKQRSQQGKLPSQFRQVNQSSQVKLAKSKANSSQVTSRLDLPFVQVVFGFPGPDTYCKTMDLKVGEPRFSAKTPLQTLTLGRPEN